MDEQVSRAERWLYGKNADLNQLDDGKSEKDVRKTGMSQQAVVNSRRFSIVA